MRLTTDASTLLLTGDTSNWTSSSNYGSLGLKINGVEQSPLLFTANGTQTFTINLPAGTNTIDVSAGPQTRPSATVLGSFIDSFQLQGLTNYTLVPPTFSNRLFVYGDSIASGNDDSVHNGAQGWVTLVRDAGKDVMLDAFGYRALKDDAANSSAVTAFVSRITSYAPTAIWIAVGANDFGFNEWTPAAFGVQYAAFVDALHTALPSMSIFCQTPIVRTDFAGLNGVGGNQLSDYRAQITTVCNARSWTTLIDGTQILLSSDLNGGLHPTTAGHIKYANFVDPYVAVGGAFSASIPSLSNGLGQPTTLTMTRALGSTYITGDSITVAWGDGTNTVVTPTAGSTAGTATHTYSALGNYTISFTNNQHWPNPNSVGYSATTYGSGGLVADYTTPVSTTSNTTDTTTAISPVTTTPPVVPITPPNVSITLPTTTCNRGDAYNSATGQPCVNNTLITDHNTLRLHDRGSEVKTLQTYFHLAADGVFGLKTYAAVVLFQKVHSLAPDGVVGAKTWAFIY